jgi:hypothetical protein
LEHKKFGQDLLTTDDCSDKAPREGVLVLLFIMARDKDASVKRYANGAWKTSGGAPKLTKAIMPRIEETLAKMRAGDFGLGAQKHAALVTEELVKGGEMEAPAGDEPEAAVRFDFDSPETKPDSDAARIAAGKEPDTGFEELNMQRMLSGSGDKIADVLEGQMDLQALPGDVLNQLRHVASSIILEGKKRKASGPKIAAQLADTLKAVAEMPPEAVQCIEKAAEPIARAALGDNFDAAAGGPTTTTRSC